MLIRHDTSLRPQIFSPCSDLQAPEVQVVLAAGLQVPASALPAVTPVLASLTQSKPRRSGRGWAGRAA